jgi:hypothetical protein
MQEAIIEAQEEDTTVIKVEINIEARGLEVDPEEEEDIEEDFKGVNARDVRVNMKRAKEIIPDNKTEISKRETILIYRKYLARQQNNHVQANRIMSPNEETEGTGHKATIKHLITIVAIIEIIIIIETTTITDSTITITIESTRQKIANITTIEIMLANRNRFDLIKILPTATLIETRNRITNSNKKTRIMFPQIIFQKEEDAGQNQAYIFSVVKWLSLIDRLVISTVNCWLSHTQV